MCVVHSIVAVLVALRVPDRVHQARESSAALVRSLARTVAFVRLCVLPIILIGIVIRPVVISLVPSIEWSNRLVVAQTVAPCVLVRTVPSLVVDRTVLSLPASIIRRDRKETGEVHR